MFDVFFSARERVWFVVSYWVACALTRKPDGRRKRDRPRETWRKRVDGERAQIVGGSSVAAADIGGNNFASPILQRERRNPDGDKSSTLS